VNNTPGFTGAIKIMKKSEKVKKIQNQNFISSIFMKGWKFVQKSQFRGWAGFIILHGPVL
jgi:hypothetical protein